MLTKREIAAKQQNPLWICRNRRRKSARETRECEAEAAGPNGPARMNAYFDRLARTVYSPAEVAS
jgi:hypothetical protein